MSRWTRWIPGIAITFALAACGENSADTLVAPTGPSLNGGYIIGGNFNGGDGQTTSSGTTTAPAPVESDSTKSGGYIIGGN